MREEVFGLLAFSETDEGHEDDGEEGEKLDDGEDDLEVFAGLDGKPVDGTDRKHDQDRDYLDYDHRNRPC